MPKSFKSIILLISLLLGVSPLYGNLPCEDGCENKCECEKGQSSTGSGSGDGGAGNDGATGGTGGTDNGSVIACCSSRLIRAIFFSTIRNIPINKCT